MKHRRYLGHATHTRHAYSTCRSRRRKADPGASLEQARGVALAVAQHADYPECLAKAGVQVIVEVRSRCRGKSRIVDSVNDTTTGRTTPTVGSL